MDAVVRGLTSGMAPRWRLAAASVRTGASITILAAAVVLVAKSRAWVIGATPLPGNTILEAWEMPLSTGLVALVAIGVAAAATPGVARRTGWRVLAAVAVAVAASSLLGASRVVHEAAASCAVQAPTGGMRIVDGRLAPERTDLGGSCQAWAAATSTWTAAQVAGWVAIAAVASTGLAAAFGFEAPPAPPRGPLRGPLVAMLVSIALPVGALMFLSLAQPPLLGSPARRCSWYTGGGVLVLAASVLGLPLAVWAIGAAGSRRRPLVLVGAVGACSVVVLAALVAFLLMSGGSGYCTSD